MMPKPSAHNPLWMLQPVGERYPYPAGRSCADAACTAPLSRYNPGPWCERCSPCHEHARALGREVAA